ncbi:MAG TPA: hypothetical protein VIC55_01690 [Gemmatimonadaceae bacterium]|jgi:hypothetical protein
MGRCALRHRAGALVTAALFAYPLARASAQDTDTLPVWQIALGARLGTPQGWVQVRESAIAGTRLRFGPDLGVHTLHSYAFGVTRRLGARTALAITIESIALDGAITLPRDVQFNGATLEQGTTARTATHVPRFLDVTATVDHRLVTLGDRGGLSLCGGFTFVGLTFVLHGTLAPRSALHETSEDFVTQELPVPVLGVSLDLPIARRTALTADADGGYLPRVNSLRREGGEVTLSQSHARLAAGARYDLTRSLGIRATYLFTHLAQHENSMEDGNDIVLNASTVMVGITRRF